MLTRGRPVPEPTFAPGITLNEALLVPVPPPVATESVPVVTVVGARAVILVLETTVKVVALAPWKRTAVAPVNAEPLIVTSVSMLPEVGEKEVMVGAAASPWLPARESQESAMSSIG